LEKQLEKIMEDDEFLTELWKRIQRLEKKTAEKEDVADLPPEAFIHTELKRAVSIHQESKFASDEGKKITEWYNEQKEKFLDVKAQIDQRKLQCQMTFRDNYMF
jgi:hypothetical protein